MLLEASMQFFYSFLVPANRLPACAQPSSDGFQDKLGDSSTNIGSIGAGYSEITLCDKYYIQLRLL
jgi:hypothetical protein